jgi:hypothetical protein
VPREWSRVGSKVFWIIKFNLYLVALKEGSVDAYRGVEGGRGKGKWGRAINAPSSRQISIGLLIKMQ